MLVDLAKVARRKNCKHTGNKFEKHLCCGGIDGFPKAFNVYNP